MYAYRLVVKGDVDNAITEAILRGFSVHGMRQCRLGALLDVTTEDALAADKWLTSGPLLAPYPTGTLLWYKPGDHLMEAA